MATERPHPLPRERTLIVGVLLVLAAAAWAVVIRQSQASRGDAMGMHADALTMGMAAPLFLAIWVAMMVAMMFPAAAPMILAFAAVQGGKRQRDQSLVPTWLFVGSYLVVWALAGVLAYVLALAAERLADRSPWLMMHAARIGGGTLVVAGLYQLSPLKDLCLGRCRTPLQFVLGSWRDGRRGAVRMGMEHGLFCLGCCWLLFAILFPLGVMNIAAMAVLTLLIFAEKSLPIGVRVSRIAAAALIAYGLLVMLAPRLLPSMM
jgi:predicted metal-binding membrane protein